MIRKIIKESEDNVTIFSGSMCRYHIENNFILSEGRGKFIVEKRPGEYNIAINGTDSHISLFNAKLIDSKFKIYTFENKIGKFVIYII